MSEQFRCNADSCSFSSTEKTSLLIHKTRSHLVQSKTVFECGLCQDTFGSPALTEAHILKEHFNLEEELEQEEENKTASSPRASRSRSSSPSDSEPPPPQEKKKRRRKQVLSCMDCSKTFATESWLNRHRRKKHTEEEEENEEGHRKKRTGPVRPCACPHCPKRFFTNTKVSEHIQRFHPDEEENKKKKPMWVTATDKNVSSESEEEPEFSSTSSEGEPSSPSGAYESVAVESVVTLDSSDMIRDCFTKKEEKVEERQTRIKVEPKYS